MSGGANLKTELAEFSGEPKSTYSNWKILLNAILVSNNIRDAVYNSNLFLSTFRDLFRNLRATCEFFRPISIIDSKSQIIINTSTDNSPNMITNNFEL